MLNRGIEFGERMVELVGEFLNQETMERVEIDLMRVGMLSQVMAMSAQMHQFDGTVANTMATARRCLATIDEFYGERASGMSPEKKMDWFRKHVGLTVKEALDGERDASLWVHVSMSLLVFSMQILGKANGIPEETPQNEAMEELCDNIHREMVDFCNSLRPENN